MNKNYDVIVCGGGTAGIAAALSASRAGKKTLVIEKNAYVGGTAASGLPFIDFFNLNGKQIISGIAQEIVDRLKKENATLGHIMTNETEGHLNSITFIDPEWVKIVAEEMLLESGCEILYHSFVCAATVENSTLKGITVANKAGLTQYTAKCFIDTTGDADLSYFAGVEYENGRAEDGLCQAMSLMFKLGDVDVEKVTSNFSENPIVAQAVGAERAYNLHVNGKLTKWNDIVRKENIFPEDDHNIWAGTMRENELTYVNTIRVSEKNGADPYELTQAEIEARKQLKRLMKLFNNHIEGLEKAHITHSANGIGVRETRRIKGVYTLTGEDVLQGGKFDDAISRNGYCIDIHDPKGKGWISTHIESADKYYQIPYRCLVPEKIDGLLVAGRCISTDVRAHASARIMPSCMAMGQAAGLAAAIAIDSAKTPRDIDVNILQSKLKCQGAIL